MVKKTETKDLGESQPATRIVWTITGRRKDPQAEGTIVISCPTKLGEENHINRVIIYGGSLGAGQLPIFAIEEPEQIAALKALKELGMIDLDQDAQDSSEVNVLKGRIWEAEAAQRNFSAGLPHCRELNGTNFYFYPGNRVLNLQDNRRSLDNLVAEGAFNAETRRPWNRQDAEARWAQQATTDQANCAAVANLPSLRQKLKELEQRQ